MGEVGTEYPRQPVSTISSKAVLWRTELGAALSGRPETTFTVAGESRRSSDIRAGARRWINCFRIARLHPGDRVVLALAPSPHFIEALIAGLWEELTVTIARPDDVRSLAIEVDARLAIADNAADFGGVTVWTPGDVDRPESMAPLAPSSHAPTPAIRFLFRGLERPWRAVTDQEAFAVIEAVAADPAMRGSEIVSTLPWHSAEGILAEILGPLVGRAEHIIRPDSRPAQIETILRIRRWLQGATSSP